MGHRTETIALLWRQLEIEVYELDGGLPDALDVPVVEAQSDRLVMARRAVPIGDPARNGSGRFVLRPQVGRQILGIGGDIRRELVVGAADNRVCGVREDDALGRVSNIGVGEPAVAPA